MKYRKIGNKFIVRIDKGEEVIKKITELCHLENITLGNVSGLGAADYVKIGLFDTIKKEYNSLVIEDVMEITSLTGNISKMNDVVYLHLHINVSDKEMKVRGGHLNECKVSATCELVIEKIEGHINRKFNDEIGLNLYDF